MDWHDQTPHSWSDTPEAPLVEVLETLRRAVHARLERLAELVAQRPLQIEAAGVSQGSPESQFEAQVAALESERRLLGQAWERLEKERLELFPGGYPDRGETDSSPSPSASPSAPPKPVRPPTQGVDLLDSRAAESVLLQFRRLQREVRQAAEHRSTS